jgi:hypothetical protein
MNAEHTYPATHNDRDVHQAGDRLTPSSDLFEYFRQYAREQPEVVALWCLGIGFVLGWKLKPW